jgi:hypothetical protein
MNIKGWQKHHENPEWDSIFPSEDLTSMLCLPRLGSYFFCRWDNLWDYEARAPRVVQGTLEEKGLGDVHRYSIETGIPIPGISVADDHYVIDNLPKPTSVLVWHKVGGAAVFGGTHGHHRDFETVLFYTGPEHKFKKRPKSVLTYRPPGNDIHVTQKPVPLVKEIMGWYDFETVLDPYMGSGTTAVAAKELGKHFLGFEADEKNYSEAIRRIADTPGPVTSR